MADGDPAALATQFSLHTDDISDKYVTELRRFNGSLVRDPFSGKHCLRHGEMTSADVLESTRQRVRSAATARPGRLRDRLRDARAVPLKGGQCDDGNR